MEVVVVDEDEDDDYDGDEVQTGEHGVLAG